MSTVAEAVGGALGKLGAGHAFGVVGSGNFAMTNALRAAGVPFVATRHEGGAATMADAYARMSGRVGVVSLHQGCGLTNAVTGIAEAAKSRTPLIVLAADTPAAALLSNFRIDQEALARSVGAIADRVYGATTAACDVARAYRTAVTERRTVLLNVALDVQAQVADPIPPVAVPSAAPVRPDAAAVEALVAMLRAARRPVFIAGRGGRGAGPQIAALAGACGALLATSAVANGLFGTDPYALGISGGFSSPTSAELIAEADLVVGWGCALNDWTTRHGRLLGPGASLVQVDLDVSALGAHRRIDLGIVGDCGRTAMDAMDALAVVTADGPVAGYRTADVATRIAASSRWQDVPVADASAEGRIDPRALTIALDRLLPTERIVAVDSGNFMGYPATHLSVPDESGFCFTQAFQSIGLGLATAIGAACARPDRLPVLGTGDGGFLMSIAELETAVRLGLPLVVIVYNDAAYGAEVHHFGAADMATVTFPDADIAAIARGFGAAGVTVRGVGDLGAVTDWLGRDPAAPLVLDAKITSDGGAWWLADAFARH